MAEEQAVAHGLRGIAFRATSPTLGVLRLDTTDGAAHWFLVDRRNLLRLAAEAARHAEELKPVG